MPTTVGPAATAAPVAAMGLAMTAGPAESPLGYRLEYKSDYQRGMAQQDLFTSRFVASRVCPSRL